MSNFAYALGTCALLMVICFAANLVPAKLVKDHNSSLIFGENASTNTPSGAVRTDYQFGKNLKNNKQKHLK